jgi:pyrroline-5-carboxylate reductase
VCASSFAILGAGHLATALIEGFSRTQGVPISIHNRSAEHALKLAQRFPNLKVFEEAVSFDLETCPLLVVIPGRALLEMPDARVDRLRRSGRVIVSCINGLPLSALERQFPGIPWVKAIPNVAASVGLSVTLISKGTALDAGSFEDVREIFGHVGKVIAVPRGKDMDRFAVVTSCFPGLLSAIFDELAVAYGLTERQTSDLLIESSIGSLLLAKERNVGFREVVASVSNPGGLTEVGVSTIRQKLPPVLAELKKALESKQEQRLQQYLEILNRRVTPS